MSIKKITPPTPEALDAQIKELLSAVANHKPLYENFKVTVIVQSRLGVGAAEAIFNLSTFAMLVPEGLDRDLIMPFFEKVWDQFRGVLQQNMKDEIDTDTFTEREDGLNPIAPPNVTPFISGAKIRGDQ